MTQEGPKRKYSTPPDSFAANWEREQYLKAFQAEREQEEQVTEKIKKKNVTREQLHRYAEARVSTARKARERAMEAASAREIYITELQDTPLHAKLQEDRRQLGEQGRGRSPQEEAALQMIESGNVPITPGIVRVYADRLGYDRPRTMAYLSKSAVEKQQREQQKAPPRA